MKIRIGREGEYRPVEIHEVYATMGGGVHVIGRMAFGSAEDVYVLLDADALSKIAQAASERGQANPPAEQTSD